MESIGKFTSGLVLLIVAMFIGGFVVMKLYNWFLPKIYGLDEISIFQAMALSLTIGYLNQKTKKEENKEDYNLLYDMGKTTLRGIILAVFVLLTGWILKGFI